MTRFKEYIRSKGLPLDIDVDENSEYISFVNVGVETDNLVVVISSYVMDPEIYIILRNGQIKERRKVGSKIILDDVSICPQVVFNIRKEQ